MHTFQVPVTVKGYTGISWETDRKDLVDLAQVNGNTVMVTTRGAGDAKIIARAGADVSGSTTLTITKSTPEEWAIGENRYKNAAVLMIDRMQAMQEAMMMGGMINIPDDLSCKNCHGSGAMALSVEHTPQQTGGYSDEDLVKIFTMGMKPPKAGWKSGIPEPLYMRLHTWSATEEEKRGLIAYIRSLTPAPQGDIDFGGRRRRQQLTLCGFGARARRTRAAVGSSMGWTCRALPLVLVLFGCVRAHDVDAPDRPPDRPPGDFFGALGSDCVAMAEAELDGLPRDLACAGLYKDVEDKDLADGMREFTPAVPLWSDGAEKARWIYLPPGTRIDNSQPERLDLSDRYQVLQGVQRRRQAHRDAALRQRRATTSGSAPRTSGTRTRPRPRARPAQAESAPRSTSATARPTAFPAAPNAISAMTAAKTACSASS